MNPPDAHEEIRHLLYCSQRLRSNISRTIEEFRETYSQLLQILQEAKSKNNTDSSKPSLQLTSLSLDDDGRFLPLDDNMFEAHRFSQRPALVIFGANSSGKTSFIQRFLGIGNILPADIGPVTARIVQFSYAPANKACYIVYATVEKTQIESQGDLSSFFINPAKPAWETIAQKLLPHVERPSQMATRSAEFKHWAARFIEVKLPSNVLEWGIDIYDTPGYLSGKREEVLMENLHALVKRVQPTLLFLYENASINETERSCFLGMKEALNDLTRVPIFFLATKADCNLIAADYSLNEDPEKVPSNVFQKTLATKRQLCYDLLRRRTEMASEVLGSLPVQVDDCSCFDIFTVPSEWDLWITYTKLITTNSTRRIVQFAVESFSIPIRAVSRDMLALVANYFDLMGSTTPRTPEQWTTLRDEALAWGEKFFIEFSRLIPVLIDTLLQRIRRLFEEQKEEIARQAAELERPGDPLDIILQDKRKRIRDYVRLAAQEKIIKVAANQVIIEKSDEVKKKLATHFEQDGRVRRNELLAIAQRQALSEITATVLMNTSVFNTLVDNIVKIPMYLGRFWRSLPSRLSTTAQRKANEWFANQTTDFDAEMYKWLDAMDDYATLSNETSRRIFAEHYLTKFTDRIETKKSNFNSNLIQWIDSQRDAFITSVNTNYWLIKDSYKQSSLSDAIDRFSGSFARIECQLLAALQLAERKGTRPVLREPLGTGGFYSVHAAEWDTEKNLAVKRLLNPSAEHRQMMAFEVHYHRAVTGFDRIAPFRYVYEHDLPDNQREFWLIMPRYSMSLQEHLKKNMPRISLERTVSFAVAISKALSELHRCEFVHRDLKASNIMLDDDQQCCLIDFGTAKLGLLNKTIVGTIPLPPEILAPKKNRPDDVGHYDGAAADIYSFGCVLYEMFPKQTYERLEMNKIQLLNEWLNSVGQSDALSKEYKSLTVACLGPDPMKRPRAAELVSRLKVIQEKLEMKLCTICEEKERSLRFQPCGHKVTCDECWDTWCTQPQSRNQCTLCKVIVTGHTRDVINSTFYLVKK